MSNSTNNSEVYANTSNLVTTNKVMYIVVENVNGVTATPVAFPYLMKARRHMSKLFCSVEESLRHENIFVDRLEERSAYVESNINHSKWSCEIYEIETPAIHNPNFDESDNEHKFTLKDLLDIYVDSHEYIVYNKYGEEELFNSFKSDKLPNECDLNKKVSCFYIAPLTDLGLKELNERKGTDLKSECYLEIHLDTEN